MKKKNLAFTLAEVLIVIGIIGVVAALTLPNLNHATGDKERVTKVKKIYAALNDAYDRAQVVYGDPTGWYDYAMNRDDNENEYAADWLFTDRIADFLKTSKNFTTEAEEKMVKLPDGLEFFIRIPGYPTGSNHYTGKQYLGEIYVDIDGFDKGKNEDGYDCFTFDITDQGIYPNGISDNKISCLFDISGCENGVYGASRWILENDNADYLKADENGKCKDSDIILNWTTNTSCH